MKQKEFIIRTYGKSELALLYFPNSPTKDSARKQLRHWFEINDRLRYLLSVKGRNFSPAQVKDIVDEEGEPY